jgi:acyl-[acyl-carrier-protein]-phospholipid O-acyltransferase/long-chain-fatty-acid--[acyl-carrier-protein] ligase
MTLTQFLGAFNDNVYKQTLLLLFVAVPVGEGPDAHTIDLQGTGSFLFALPFLLFSGFAGYLSDRFSKQRVIVACKLAEVGIMVGGCLLFLAYRGMPMSLPLAVLFCAGLFLMGTHSAFFGPGKYGILPELMPERDLPQANGIMLMTTFLAIIFGVLLAGQLMTRFAGDLWVIGVVCILIALVGVATSLLVRPTPAVRPELPFHVDYLIVPREMRSLLARDRQLHAAVWVSSIFWMAAQIVLVSVNALGELQFQTTKAQTSLLVGSVSIGIALGSLLAGWISRGRFHTGVLRGGAWGLTLTLVAMCLPGGSQGQLLGYGGSLACLILLGISTGLFAVPLQVLMQMRPPAELKGQMIATMNLLNWSGILLGSALYQALSLALNALHLAPSWSFAVTAVLLGLVAALYRPASEAAVERVKSA